MEKLFSHTHQLGIRRTFALPVESRACAAVEYIEHMARTGVISYHEVWDRVYDVVASHYFNLNVSIRGV